MDGWIKLHRCLLEKAIWQNHNIFRVFCWCLMKATHKEYEQMVGMTKVVLVPGQFVYGRRVASDETGLTPSTVRNCMEWLKNNQTLDINSDNKKSVITVINWASYQSGEEQKDSTLDSNVTTTGQQLDTNKNTKNIKNKRKRVLSELPSDCVQLTKFLVKKILEWKPNARIPDDLYGWANDMRLMIERDKRVPDEIAIVIEWATADERFWRANILSVDALRRGYDKIEGRMMEKKR